MHSEFQGITKCMSLLQLQQLSKIMVHTDRKASSVPKSCSSQSSQTEVVGADTDRVTLDSGVVLVRAKAKPKPKPPAPKRFYALTSGPKELLGIWHAQWQYLASHLPGGKLFGSGCVLSGHDDLEAAKAKWHTKWESEAPIHSQP